MFKVVESMLTDYNENLEMISITILSCTKVLLSPVVLT